MSKYVGVPYLVLAQVKIVPDFNNGDVPEDCLRYRVVDQHDIVLLDDMPHGYANRLCTQLNNDVHNFQQAEAAVARFVANNEAGLRHFRKRTEVVYHNAHTREQIAVYQHNRNQRQLGAG